MLLFNHDIALIIDDPERAVVWPDFFLSKNQANHKNHLRVLCELKRLKGVGERCLSSD
jgi:hypothetical protein